MTTLDDALGWAGRHAVVVGGASGMGQAAGDLVTALGGTVTVLDVKEPLGQHDRFVGVDLCHQGSIDAALAEITGPIHGLFMCAGVAEGADLPKINLIGQRHVVEVLVARGALPSGSAIGMIASIGGMGWERNLGPIRDLLATPDFRAACAWFDAHPEQAQYGFCKQAMIAYCGFRAAEFQRRGVRINATAPGPTMTPLMAATPGWQGFELAYRDMVYRDGATAEEQAWPLVFLTSPAASSVNGTCLIVDGGFVGAGTVGSISGPLVNGLLGAPADS